MAFSAAFTTKAPRPRRVDTKGSGGCLSEPSSPLWLCGGLGLKVCSRSGGRAYFILCYRNSRRRGNRRDRGGRRDDGLAPSAHLSDLCGLTLAAGRIEPRMDTDEGREDRSVVDHAHSAHSGGIQVIRRRRDSSCNLRADLTVQHPMIWTPV